METEGKKNVVRAKVKQKFYSVVSGYKKRVFRRELAFSLSAKKEKLQFFKSLGFTGRTSENQTRFQKFILQVK